MSYKGVIKRGGKVYGPYKYESYRDKDGKVKKRYLGKVGELKGSSFIDKLKKKTSSIKSIKVKSSTFFYAGIFILLLFLFLVFYHSANNNSEASFISDLKNSIPNRLGKITNFVILNTSDNTSPVGSEEPISIKNISTLQYKAVVGRPVRWLKKLNVNASSISVELPKNSKNISILTNDEIDTAVREAGNYRKVVGDTDRKKIVKGVALTGNVVIDTGKKENVLSRFWKWLTNLRITGNVILEEQLSKNITENSKSTVVNIGDIVDNKTEVAVEYYTPAPVANETVLSNGKRVIVSAPSELNYTDILAYSVVKGMGIRMDDPRLKLYWYEDAGSPSKEVVPTPIPEENVENTSVSNGSVFEENKNDTLIPESISNISDEENTSTLNVSNENDTSTVNVSNENDTSTVNVSNENDTSTLNISNEENSSSLSVSNEENSSSLVSDNDTEILIEENTTDEILEDNTTKETVDTIVTGNVVSSKSGVKSNVKPKAVESGDDNLNLEVKKYLNPDVKVNRKRKEVSFVPYDFDGDGYVDYIEWVVPHLSVQVYEIIYVTQAEHLDSNREYLSDVYPEVSKLDNIWSDFILDGEYLRVLFEKKLNDKNDITIRARSNGSSSIEVYTKDGVDMVAKFDNIGKANTQKVYLTNLTGPSDSFDLKVIGDPVEFDYVTDPTPITSAIPQTFNIHGRLLNSTRTPLVGSYIINFSIYDVYTGGVALWNNSRNVTTDEDGIYNVILNASGLNFTDQYYLGITVGNDAEMTPRLNLTSSAYAFTAQQVYVGGIIFDDNMNASGHNITADYFIGDGSLLTGISGGSGTSGGWTNDSSNTNTSLNVNIDGNVTSNGRFLAGDGAYNKPAYSFNSLKNVGMGVLDADTIFLTYPLSGDLQIINSDGSTGLWITDLGTKFKDGSAAVPGIGFIQDSNTGMFRAANDIIGFSTNALERMRIDGSGNVGIGTASPSSKLDVNGSINISGTSAALYFPDGSNMTTAASGSGSSIWTESGNNATYDGNVNVTGDLIVKGVNWSQSTGAIIESGSTGNGRYVKYADGTMVEWGNISNVDITTVEDGLYYNAGQDQVNFPVNFSSNPVVTFSVQDTNWALAWAGRVSSLDIDGFRTTAIASRSSADRSVDWQAIGRWTDLNLGSGSGGNGGIVNTITNENGTCTQYSNGVMECYNYFNSVTTDGGGTFYWTLPAEFADLDYMSTGSMDADTRAYSISRIESSQQTTSIVRLRTYGASTTINDVNVFATGRWTKLTSVNTPDVSTWGLNTSSGDIEVVNTSRDVSIPGNLSLGSGKIRYNSTSNSYEFYNGSVWQEIGTGTGSSIWTNVSGTATYEGNVNVSNMFLDYGTVGAPSFSFNGDSNTGIYHVAADRIGFSMGGTNMLTISTSAVYTNGKIAAGSGASSSPGYQFTDNGNTGMFNPSAYNIGFSTNALERMRIDGSGNVGIGTASPSSKLDVNGSISLALKSISSGITLDGTNSVVLVNTSSGNVTVNLPTSSGIKGRVYKIKKIDSSLNTVIIEGFGSETIDLALNLNISSQFKSYDIVSDGGNWWII